MKKSNLKLNNNTLLIIIGVVFIGFFLIFLYPSIHADMYGNDDDTFIPSINEKVRPLVRNSRQAFQNYPYPNFNRFLNDWGIY